MKRHFGAIAAIAVALSACSPSNNQRDSLIDSEPFQTPPIATISLEGMRELIEGGRGSFLVVNLWATWCPPCVSEMPALAKFYRNQNDGEVTFLSFSADETDTIDELVKPFINSYEIPFPVWVMESAERDELNAAFEFGWDGLFPTTFLFTPSGALVQRWEGEVTFEALSEALMEAQSAPAPQETALN